MLFIVVFREPGKYCCVCLFRITVWNFEKPVELYEAARKFAKVVHSVVLGYYAPVCERALKHCKAIRGDGERGS